MRTLCTIRTVRNKQCNQSKCIDQNLESGQLAISENTGVIPTYNPTEEGISESSQIKEQHETINFFAKKLGCFSENT